MHKITGDKMGLKLRLESWWSETVSVSGQHNTSVTVSYVCRLILDSTELQPLQKNCIIKLTSLSTFPESWCTWPHLIIYCIFTAASNAEIPIAAGTCIVFLLCILGGNHLFLLGIRKVQAQALLLFRTWAQHGTAAVMDGPEWHIRWPAQLWTDQHFLATWIVGFACMLNC